MPSFPTEHARLKVRNPAGDVQVETADVAETTVELVPLNDSDATRQAIEKANVGARGDEVFVELEGRSWSISIGSWGVGSAKVSVRISCPHGSDLACDTASADVRGTGTLGEVRFRTASGDLRLDRVQGALEAKTASGDVRVEHAEGPVSMNTVSGDVGLDTAMGGLAVNSVSGDVVLGEVFGDLTAGTVSGDLMVRAAGPGEVGLKAVSGDVVRRDAPRAPRPPRRQLGERLGRLGARRQRHADARRRAGGESPRPHRQRRRADHPRGRGRRVAMRKPGGLWRHRDFLSLWGAETISQFGTQVTFLALPLVAILALDESAFKVAALTALQFLPFLLFTLPAGVWVDRLRRKPILVAGDLGRALALVSIPLAHWFGDADDLAPLRGRLRRTASAPSSSTSRTSRICRRSSGATRWSRETRSSRSAAPPPTSAAPGWRAVSSRH